MASAYSSRGGKVSCKFGDACPYKHTRGGPAMAATTSGAGQAPGERPSKGARRRARSRALSEGTWGVAVARKATLRLASRGGTQVPATAPEAPAAVIPVRADQRRRAWLCGTGSPFDLTSRRALSNETEEMVHTASVNAMLGTANGTIEADTQVTMQV